MKIISKCQSEVQAIDPNKCRSNITSPTCGHLQRCFYNNALQKQLDFSSCSATKTSSQANFHPGLTPETKKLGTHTTRSLKHVPHVRQIFSTTIFQDRIPTSFEHSLQKKVYVCFACTLILVESLTNVLYILV